jgi:hypothetical protein
MQQINVLVDIDTICDEKLNQKIDDILILLEYIIVYQIRYCIESDIISMFDIKILNELLLK